MAKGFKTGGRQKGSPNKTTREIRELLSSILCNEIEKIPQYLKEIEPEKRMNLLVKLLPYILPFHSGKEEDSIDDTSSFISLLNQQIIEQNLSNS